MLVRYKLSLVLLVSLIFSGKLAYAGEAELTKLIKEAYPKVNLESVVKTSFSGLYEVLIDGQIIYTDENFSHFIAGGQLIQTKGSKNITMERLSELKKVNFGSLPLEQAIKIVKGDGSRKVAVFSDPDCPYCKKIESETLSKLDNATIYVFLYPILQLHPDARNKATAIWCASNQAVAWANWMLAGALPDVKTSLCANPIQKNIELAKKLHVDGTPMLILENGEHISGFVSLPELEKRLEANQ